MIRGLTIFAFGAVLLSLFSVPVMVLSPGAMIVGGHYYVGPGETLKDDVSFYFAQVTVDESAAVDGHLFLYSSTLDLRGYVAEDIHAFESDLTVHENAMVGGEIDEQDFVHWTVLLPAIVHLP